MLLVISVYIRIVNDRYWYVLEWYLNRKNMIVCDRLIIEVRFLVLWDNFNNVILLFLI